MDRQVKRSNPYSLDRIWDEQTLKAYCDMPKRNGYNFRLHARSSPAEEAEWRQWCSRWPRDLWPLHVWDYANVKGKNL